MRTRPNNEQGTMSDFVRIEQALEYLHRHAQTQPSLDEVAAAIHVSPFHFQRMFKRWVGVSPKRYLQNLNATQAKTALRAGSTVLEITYDLGLSAPSRLHDLFVSLEAMSPGEYKSQGEGVPIRFGIHWSPLGPCCVALTNRGICALHFIEQPDAELALAILQKTWPNAEFIESNEEASEIVYQIFHASSWTTGSPFRLSLRGTNFQIQVWRALLEIPAGTTVSYSDLSAAIGRSPSHARAVANAIGANPIAYLIPCHRVIRGSGELGGYRWGIERKAAILEAETPD